MSLFLVLCRYYDLKANLEEECTPLEWWKAHRGAFPILQHLAARYLAVPASSASCERVFSQAGLTLSKLRTRMAPDLFEALMTLKYQHQDSWCYLTPAEWMRLKEEGVFDEQEQTHDQEVAQ